MSLRKTHHSKKSLSEIAVSPSLGASAAASPVIKKDEHSDVLSSPGSIVTTVRSLSRTAGAVIAAAYRSKKDSDDDDTKLEDLGDSPVVPKPKIAKAIKVPKSGSSLMTSTSSSLDLKSSKHKRSADADIDADDDIPEEAEYVSRGYPGEALKSPESRKMLSPSAEAATKKSILKKKPTPILAGGAGSVDVKPEASPSLSASVSVDPSARSPTKDDAGAGAKIPIRSTAKTVGGAASPSTRIEEKNDDDNFFDPYEGDDGESLVYVRITDKSPPVYQENNHVLRYGLRRKPRIFLVVTMYNEGRDELEGSLKGVGHNLAYMMKQPGLSEIWKEFVVCIVIDGRAKANADTLDYMTEIGICNPQTMTDSVALTGEGYDPVSVHLFESTIQLKDTETDLEFLPKMNMMVAIKERNAGKLDSHWWFYTAFSSVLNPDYCFLLDVGTIPKAPSFYYMFKALERDDNIAGVAGEITTASAINLLNPLVAAQQFEYKISCILDKTTESMFGYISVLPGAFSAYRWTALQGEPLKKYFHHLITPLKKTKPFESNMYLAEDRILCYELVGKQGCKYTLAYVKEAVAATDVPTKLPALIKQRRRWLNGSLFALLYAMFGWKTMLTQSSHSSLRKFFLSFQFVYFIVMVLLQWFAIANLYLTCYFLLQQMEVPQLFTVVNYVFLSLLVVQVILGMGNRPDRVGSVYVVVSMIYGMLMIGIFSISILQVLQNSLGFIVWGSVAASFGSIFAVSVFYGSFGEVIFSFFQYLFFSATYIVMFSLYSLCNTHDISWGTKNLDEAKFAATNDMIISGQIDSERMKAKVRHMQKLQQEEKYIRDKIQAKFEGFRSYLLLIWLLMNGFYAAILTSFKNPKVRTWYLMSVFGLVCAMSLIRSIGAMMYIVANMFHHCMNSKLPKRPSVIYRPDEV